MGNTQTLIVDPLTFAEMFKREGLPASTILREDDVTWDLWMRNTRLPQVGQQCLYPAKLVNTGEAVRVISNKRDFGAIEPRALPIAVEALTAYGGKEAPCYIVASDIKSRTNSVYVVKPRKLRG